MKEKNLTVFPEKDLKIQKSHFFSPFWFFAAYQVSFVRILGCTISNVEILANRAISIEIRFREKPAVFWNKTGFNSKKMTKICNFRFLWLSASQWNESEKNLKHFFGQTDLLKRWNANFKSRLEKMNLEFWPEAQFEHQKNSTRIAISCFGFFDLSGFQCNHQLRRSVNLIAFCRVKNLHRHPGRFSVGCFRRN